MRNYNTAYDDVFRTLLTDCRKLIIPVVNEIFHEAYTGTEEVTLRENEIFMGHPNGEQEKRVTDSSFTISVGEVVHHYHLECQSRPDGTMVLRMYEYDSQIALKEGKWEGNRLVVHFPESAILYLRHNRNTPDTLTITINTPGGSVSYEVLSLKVKTYSIETIFKKRLLFLLPFYIFTYEEEFTDIEKSEEKLQQLKETYEGIVKRLDQLCKAGELDEYTKKAICELSEKVVEALAIKNATIKREVVEVMGGKILDYEAKDILLRGRTEGREEGRIEGRKEGRIEGREEGMAYAVEKLLKKGYSSEEISNMLEMEPEEVKKIENTVFSLK
ncbi:MAG: hypothetical protein ACI4DN_01270 [Lachnospiraceae bacterium]